MMIMDLQSFYHKIIKYALLIFLILVFCEFGFSQSYTGSIIRVIDGDTFVFQTEEGSLRVRMFGTDSPERDQPFAKESAEFMQQYLNQPATLKATGVDRYGRTLGVLYINGKDINLLSIRNGCAWHFKRYSSDHQYATAEE